MADVIFNGTGTRPPISIAEVSLTLVNPEYEQAGAEEEKAEFVPEPDRGDPQAEAGGNGNGAASATSRAGLKVSAGEITVTRRLFRSGESEYLINGETCRLRDIQDLFMGTGLGPESYAIIEQGRIGQILSSKPSDRRSIIEEAAGVSKFKTRKRLAEAKLESSRQNLARIADILEEVSKQVNSLKRQASKARRYRELQEESRRRLRTVLASRLVALETDCQRVREELAAIELKCRESAEQLEQHSQEQKTAALRHEELQGSISQLREEIAQRDLERERIESRLNQARQQVLNLESRTAEASQEKIEVESQLGSLEQAAAERARQTVELRKDLASARAAVTVVLARQEALAYQIKSVESEVELCRQAALEAVSHAADLRNQTVQAEEASLSLERQASRAGAENASIVQEHARLAAALDASQGENQRSAGALADLARSVSHTAARLEEARAAETARRTELEDFRQEISRVTARKQVLEESLARHAYSTESARRLLSGTSGNGDSFHPLGLLVDFVEVSSGYEEVVEEFLKHELEGVVVARHAEARSGIALLRSEGTGRSTFFVTQMTPNGHSSGGPRPEMLRERGVLARVRDLVRFEDRLGLNGDLAFPALENAYLVEDDTAAERLSIQYPECHFLTPTGEHYHHRLVSGGKSSSAGPLALRKEFRLLERRLGDLQSATRKAEETLARAVEAGARLEEEFRSLTAAQIEAEKKMVLAEEKMRQAREGYDRAEERLRTLQHELAALKNERRDVQARLAQLRGQLEAAVTQQAEREDEIQRKTSLLREIRTQLDQGAQESVEAQGRATALEERSLAAEAEQRRLAIQVDKVRARLAHIADQITGWLDEQNQRATEVQALEGCLGELATTQRTAREQLRNLEQEFQGVRARRDELAARVDAARGELDILRDQRSQAGVALARAESDYAHQVQQCRDELNTEPANLIGEFPPAAVLAGDALQAEEAELGQIKTRIENLGAVNMMALEELQEAEERLTFLDTQRQDLLASIEDTTQAIREIDQVSRLQFLEAFKAINGYFAETFRTLFGGGIGEMRLADEADPDSGIDIAAQPPGKRLQNVLLLSGGEKALAALALLIAIFRYTPSPFCILDEVDAPLDESNVDRFIRLVQHMSRHTQFILITHNKRTMEMAQILYGVTMEEPGVSKLVSVRFEELARQPVAVGA